MISAEQFSNLVKGTEALAEVGFEELQELADAYPYCRNAHFLVLLKARQEDRQGSENLLERAATYSIDRPFLFARLQQFAEQLEAESAAQEEAPFDLDELRMMGRPPREEAAVVQEEVSVGQEELSVATIEPYRPETRLAENLVAILGGKPLFETPAKKSFTADAAEVLVAFSGTLDPYPWKEIAPAAPPPLPEAGQSEPELPDPVFPIPKRSFASWGAWAPEKRVVELLHGRFITEPEKKSKKGSGKSGGKKKKKKKSKIKAFAEQSLLEHDEVVSETLAELLVQQERYARAIRVYEGLRLKFPEKSGYFAGIIEKLNKLK